MLFFKILVTIIFLSSWDFHWCITWPMFMHCLAINGRFCFRSFLTMVGCAMDRHWVLFLQSMTTKQLLFNYSIVKCKHVIHQWKSHEERNMMVTKILKNNIILFSENCKKGHTWKISTKFWQLYCYQLYGPNKMPQLEIAKSEQVSVVGIIWKYFTLGMWKLLKI